MSLALLGVCCVLTGIILGALHMTIGTSFLTLSLMFVGELRLVCVCVCVCVCVYVCMYVCMYMYVCMSACVCVGVLEARMCLAQTTSTPKNVLPPGLHAVRFVFLIRILKLDERALLGC